MTVLQVVWAVVKVLEIWFSGRAVVGAGVDRSAGAVAASIVAAKMLPGGGLVGRRLHVDSFKRNEDLQ